MENIEYFFHFWEWVILVIVVFLASAIYNFKLQCSISSLFFDKWSCPIVNFQCYIKARFSPIRSSCSFDGQQLVLILNHIPGTNVV